MAQKDASHFVELRRAIAGDTSAMDRLLLSHRDSLARYVRSEMPEFIRNQCDIEDVLQEVFRDAFIHIGSFKDNGDRAFRAWLRMIAKHRVIDFARRSNARVRIGDNPAANCSLDDKSISLVLNEVEALTRTPSESVSRRMRLRILDDELLALPERQRTAVILRMVQGLNWDAIGQHLGCSTDAAEKLYTRAIKAVSQRLARGVAASEKR